MKVNIGKVKKDGTQKVEVKIDPWDTWGCDVTLCHIIHPLFKEFKSTANSVGILNKEDVPEYLHCTYTEDEVASYSKESYDWVLDEIIWATQPDWDDLYGCGADLPLDVLERNHKRQKKAMELFGKYFFTFWN